MSVGGVRRLLQSHWLPGAVCSCFSMRCQVRLSMKVPSLLKLLECSCISMASFTRRSMYPSVLTSLCFTISHSADLSACPRPVRKQLRSLIGVTCEMHDRNSHTMGFVIVCEILGHPVSIHIFTNPVGPGKLCAHYPATRLALG